MIGGIESGSEVWSAHSTNLKAYVHSDPPLSHGLASGSWIIKCLSGCFVALAVIANANATNEDGELAITICKNHCEDCAIFSFETFNKHINGLRRKCF